MSAYAKISPPATEMARAIGSALTMPRWKMLDVIWLDHYWEPRALIVGIIRAKDDPNRISYDCVNESECTNGFSASTCLSEAEWRESMERFLRDEYTPRDWRARMEKVAGFREPRSWQEFRDRWLQTGDPYLPTIIDGKVISCPWQIDQTYPQNPELSAPQAADE